MYRMADRGSLYRQLGHFGFPFNGPRLIQISIARARARAFLRFFVNDPITVDPFGLYVDSKDAARRALKSTVEIARIGNARVQRSILSRLSRSRSLLQTGRGAGTLLNPESRNLSRRVPRNYRGTRTDRNYTREFVIGRANRECIIHKTSPLATGCIGEPRSDAFFAGK